MKLFNNKKGTENFFIYIKELSKVPQDRFVCKEYEKLKKRSLVRSEVDLPENMQLFLINYMINTK
jgi:hypothetical protein